jgi:hypothetical protein
LEGICFGIFGRLNSFECPQVGFFRGFAVVVFYGVARVKSKSREAALVSA